MSVTTRAASEHSAGTNIFHRTKGPNIYRCLDWNANSASSDCSGGNILISPQRFGCLVDVGMPGFTELVDLEKALGELPSAATKEQNHPPEPAGIQTK